MPSQLQRRLERLLDPSVARTINALSGVSLVDSPAAPNNTQLHDLTTQPHRNTRPHWGDGLTKPSSITPALRKARISLSTRLSDTRAATRAIKPS